MLTTPPLQCSGRTGLGCPLFRSRPSALLDTRVIYCGDCLEQLAKLPPDCIDLMRGGIDPPFNSNRNYEVFWMGRAHTLAERSAAFATAVRRSGA